MLVFKVEVITGWVPSAKLPDKFINLIGTLAGRDNIAYGLRKRRPTELEPGEIKSCAFAEFFIQFLLLLSKFRLIKRDNAVVLGWKTYGWQSKKYIKNASIFHVRSGAGQGGAIRKARKAGMKIIVDHSIAHPNEVFNQLKKSNNGIDDEMSITPNSGFWQLVLEDCNQANVIQVNSEYVKKSFVENGFNPEIIKVVHLGVRTDFYGLKTDYTIKIPYGYYLQEVLGGERGLISLSNL
ncbi:MAG: hypothetical protein IPF54_08390 [Draconibacterium sp.]|nr:hypothetical protein [Draconibacterium sp.]